MMSDDESEDGANDSDSETDDCEAELVNEVSDILTYDSDETECESENDNDFDENEFDERAIQWSQTPAATPGRRRKRNILHSKPGPTATPESRLESFELFIDHFITSRVVSYTNMKIQMTRLSMTQENRCTKQIADTDEQEMRAFYAILIIGGITHSNTRSLSSLWRENDLFQIRFFSGTMSRDRFKLLLSCIRFDDKSLRQTKTIRFEGKDVPDKLAAIREIEERMISNCKQHYVPNSCLTVDERIVPFRGRCGFRVFMPAKPHKYGIKVMILADCESKYVKNYETYTGKQGLKPEKEQGRKVVLRLSSCLSSGHSITTDNFFTSYKLALQLLDKNITLLGTMRRNRKEIPKVMLPDKRRAIESSIFRFTSDITLVSYVPKKGKAVILLSSQHQDAEISNDEHFKSKPIMILDYNKTKCGVDLVDQMIEEYTVRRKTRRWPFALFMNMIEISLLNAYVVWKASFPMKKETRIHFLESLALELVNEHVSRRSEKTLKRSVKQNVSCIMNNIRPASASSACPEMSMNAKRAKRYACNDCTKKSTHCCDLCSIGVCRTHSVTSISRLCKNCASK